MKELGVGKCVSRKLSPGSVETIRNGLFYYRTDRPAWIERYFPAIAQRGYIDYEDIDAMSEEQAGATRLLLTDGLVYWLSKLRKARAAGISLRPDRPAEEELGLECQIQVKRHKEAPADVCRAYDLMDFAASG